MVVFGRWEVSMLRVKVEEFDKNPAKYLASEEAIQVERDGEVLGVFLPRVREATLPLPGNVRPDAKEAMHRLEMAVERVLDETGLTEDELADLFDLNKPLPDGPIGRRKSA
jgi:hypothetical protein